MGAVAYSVRELQARIGKALESVRKGNRVWVTSRGRPVALLVPPEGEAPGESPVERKLNRLAAEGKIRLGNGKAVPPFKALRMGGLVAQVLADRR